jgi:hypothetical protein
MNAITNANISNKIDSYREIKALVKNWIRPVSMTLEVD